jgi:hypothetical protein
VCFWEDDGVQLRWPDWSGGANSPAWSMLNRIISVSEQVMKGSSHMSGSPLRKQMGGDVRPIAAEDKAELVRSTDDPTLGVSEHPVQLLDLRLDIGPR